MNEVQTHLVHDRAAGLSRTLPLLVIWFFGAIALGLSGALASDGAPPVGLGLAIAVPLVVFTVDARLGSPLFRGLRQLDLAALVALQTFRVGGALFLVAWLGGTLPGGFALPAGLGDIAVGVSAPFVAAAIARRSRGHRALALGWNIAGTIDLVTAVSLGVMHSSSAFGVFASDGITTDALALYPFSIIPTFFVPLGLVLHAVVFKLLGRREIGYT